MINIRVYLYSSSQSTTVMAMRWAPEAMSYFPFVCFQLCFGKCQTTVQLCLCIVRRKLSTFGCTRNESGHLLQTSAARVNETMLQFSIGQTVRYKYLLLQTIYLCLTLTLTRPRGCDIDHMTICGWDGILRWRNCAIRQCTGNSERGSSQISSLK